MDNNHKGKIEEVIYHGDHTRLKSRPTWVINNLFLKFQIALQVEWILKQEKKLILVGTVLTVEL